MSISGNGDGGKGSSSGGWTDVTFAAPCPACLATSGCRVHPTSGTACLNEREGAAAAKEKDGHTYYLHDSKSLAALKNKRLDAQKSEIRRFLDLLHPAPCTFEIRILDIKGRGKPHNASGVFRNIDKAVTAIMGYEVPGAAGGIYVTVNPATDQCYGRSPDQITDYLEKTTSDNDVAHRRWLYIDCDPERPAGVCASDEQVEAAAHLADQCALMLREDCGWADPVKGQSGNGYCLLYRIDLPNTKDAAALVKGVLEAIQSLATHYLPVEDDSPPTKIDCMVHNAARVMRLLGTTNRKGFNIPEQPHRRSRLIDVPEYLPTLTREQLQSVIDLAETKKTSDPIEDAAETARAKINPKSESGAKFTGTASGNGRPHKLKIQDYLQAKGILATPRSIAGGTAYNFRCPFDASHTGTDAAIIQFDSGAHTFRCLHDSCRNLKNQDLYGRIGWPDPDHYDPPKVITQRRHQAPPGATESDGTKTEGSGYRCNFMDARTFMSTDFRPSWLVQRLLVWGQPGVLGGPSKTLKTSIAIDLAVSLASGKPFLGQFSVYRIVRVALVSGESGEWVIQETVRRVAAARGIDPAALNMYFDFDLPQLGNPDDVETLTEALRDANIEVLILDPAYLCLLAGIAGTEINASNFYQMGPHLRSVTKACAAVGCTLLLLHHTPKSVAKNNKLAPLDLEDLAFSGISEWARQWLLLSRRKKFEPGTGLHQLWFVGGGSTGQSGQWGLDVNEGLQGIDFTGRLWEVEVRKTGEVRDDEDDEREDTKQTAASRTVLKHGTKILEVLDRKDPDRKGCPKGLIRDLSRLSNPNFIRALEPLIEEGVLIEVPIQREGMGPKEVPGIARRPLPGETPDTSDTSDTSDSPKSVRPLQSGVRDSGLRTVGGTGKIKSISLPPRVPHHLPRNRRLRTLRTSAPTRHPSRLMSGSRGMTPPPTRAAAARSAGRPPARARIRPRNRNSRRGGSTHEHLQPPSVLVAAPPGAPLAAVPGIRGGYHCRPDEPGPA